jgi:hypothetical protein
MDLFIQFAWPLKIHWDGSDCYGLSTTKLHHSTSCGVERGGSKGFVGHSTSLGIYGWYLTHINAFYIQAPKKEKLQAS